MACLTYAFGSVRLCDPVCTDSVCITSVYLSIAAAARCQYPSEHCDCLDEGCALLPTKSQAYPRFLCNIRASQSSLSTYMARSGDNLDDAGLNQEQLDSQSVQLNVQPGPEVQPGTIPGSAESRSVLTTCCRNPCSAGNRRADDQFSNKLCMPDPEASILSRLQYLPLQQVSSTPSAHLQGCCWPIGCHGPQLTCRCRRPGTSRNACRSASKRQHTVCSARSAASAAPRSCCCVRTLHHFFEFNHQLLRSFLPELKLMLLLSILPCCHRSFQGDQGQTTQTLLQEEPPLASTSIPPILDAIARQPLAAPTSMQPYPESQDTEQHRKARRAQAQRLRRAAQSAEQRAAVAAADAARHAAARWCLPTSCLGQVGPVAAEHVQSHCLCHNESIASLCITMLQYHLVMQFGPSKIAAC